MGDAKEPSGPFRRDRSVGRLSSYKAVGSGLAPRLDFIN